MDIDKISFTKCIAVNDLYYIQATYNTNLRNKFGICYTDDEDLLKLLGLSYNEYKQEVINTIGKDNVYDDSIDDSIDILFMGEEAANKMLDWYQTSGRSYILMNILSKGKVSI